MFSCSNYARLQEGLDITFNLYKNHGNADYIGEEVSQLEHALQFAHHAAKDYPNRHDVILGAFFHDIGHLIGLDAGKTCSIKFKDESMDGLGMVDHEGVGGKYLDYVGFPKIVGNISRNHILAKRFIITKDQDYYNNLSEASKKTFWKQGGNLNSFQMESFASLPEHEIYLRSRHWDDLAKEKEFENTFGLEYLKEMAENLICGTR